MITPTTKCDMEKEKTDKIGKFKLQEIEYNTQIDNWTYCPKEHTDGPSNIDSHIGTSSSSISRDVIMQENTIGESTMETIQALNGTTKFIKPDFEVVLYEERELDWVFGRVDNGSGSSIMVKWNINDGLAYNNDNCITSFNLTPVPQPWYKDPNNFPCYYTYNPHGRWLYMKLEFDDMKNTNTDRFEEIGYIRLTQEEAMKYIS